jgi:Cellulose binding domain
MAATPSVKRGEELPDLYVMTKKHADHPRRYRITLRHALAAALGTSAGAVAVFGGVVMLLAGHSIRPQADNCGLITCSANVPTTPRPSPSPTPGAPRHHARVVRDGRHDPPPPSRRATSPSATPTPGRTHPHPRTSPTPPPPAVTVSYSVVQQWDGGFRGEFTIVNHGTTALSGWVLAATFPADHVDLVWGASYQANGSTLTLTPASYQPSIPPGGSQSASFTASGSHQAPANCTFNGKACG